MIMIFSWPSLTIHVSKVFCDYVLLPYMFIINSCWITNKWIHCRDNIIVFLPNCHKDVYIDMLLKWPLYCEIHSTMLLCILEDEDKEEMTEMKKRRGRGGNNTKIKLN